MREHMRRPRRDYDERDTNTRPLGGENKWYCKPRNSG
jgi:hypothetical protein